MSSTGWFDPNKVAGTMGRIDWSSEPGIQTVQPKAPEAVRVSYLLEQIAEEFRALKAAAVGDGKEDVLIAKSCTLELGVTWTKEADAKVNFWVLELGGGISHATAQKVTVKMTLLPEIAAHAPGAIGAQRVDADERVDWAAEQPTMPLEEAASDSGSLRLAFMLENLADEFRKAQAAMAHQDQVLRYDAITLELTGTWSSTGGAGAKFWVLDLGGGVTRERAQTLTVEMEPTRLGEVISKGIAFVRPARG